MTNPNPPTPKSIDDYGGLKAYLDHPDIRAKHNGYGYDDWTKNKHRGASFIRNLFAKKGRDFYYDWLDRDNKTVN